MGMDKVYTGTFKIGATTPSYDLETEVDQEWPTEGISEEDIQSATDQFKGLIDQVPPIFSAIKQGGKKAYEMAREGEKPELKSRQVMIHEFKVDAARFPEVDFEVKCSKGTYIRSLAHDFGAALNNGAHLTALRRVAIGPYSIEDALSLDRCLEIFQKEE